MKKLIVVCLSGLLLAQVAYPQHSYDQREKSISIAKREVAYKNWDFTERNFFSLLGCVNALRSCRVNYSAVSRHPDFTALVAASSLSAGLVSWMSLHFGMKADRLVKNMYVNSGN